MQEYMVFWQAAGALFFAPPTFLALAFPRARLLHQASPVFSFPHSKLLPFQILPLKRWPRRLDYKATLNLHNKNFLRCTYVVSFFHCVTCNSCSYLSKLVHIFQSFFLMFQYNFLPMERNNIKSNSSINIVTEQY